MKCGLGKIPNELREGRIVTSPSKLGDILTSPKHYHWKHILKRQERTDAMIEGSMIHKFILEPDDFFNHYHMPLDKDLYLTTADKIKEFLKLSGEKTTGKKEELIERALAINPDLKIYDVEIEKILASGKEIIKQSDVEMLNEIKMSIEVNPFCKQLMNDSKFEVDGWFTDELTDIIITFKIDIIKKTESRVFVIDLKKVRDVKLKEMNRWLYYSNTYIQLAMYREAVKQLFDAKDPICGVIACEVDGPYIAQPFAIDFGSIEAGEIQYKKALIKLKECYEANNWPAYDSSITNMALPTWAIEQIDYDNTKDLEGV